MTLFKQLIEAAGEAGFFGFFLPFLLTFAIIYGLLTKSKVLGEPRKPVTILNAVIALVAAFYLIGYTPIGITVAEFFGRFFTQYTVIILTVIVSVLALIVLEPFWPKEAIRDPKTGEIVGYQPIWPRLGKYTAIAILLVTIGIFINSGGLALLGLVQPGVPLIPGIILSPQDILIILFIIVTVGLILWVTGK